MRIALPATTALVLGSILLGACTVSDAPESAPSPTLNAAAASPQAAPTPTPVADAAPTPVKPGEQKTFGDWIVACDNTALCQMASLGPEDGAYPFPPVTMAVLRQPGPDGAIDLSFDVAGDEKPVRPVAVTIDSRRMPLPALNGSAAAATVAAMANGTTLAVLEAGDKRRATLSLKGASAAMRWIDAQQGRAGTVTALVAKGDRPAVTVPDRRAAPVIRAVVATGSTSKPTPKQLADMKRLAACGDDSFAAKMPPEVHALGGGTTLVMLPCSSGAYNLSSALFVIRGDAVEVAKADVPTGFGPTPAAAEDATTSVVNGAWKNGELTSYAKGRGLGDCGVMQTLVWDGTRFRLSEQSEMGECRGNPHYITTWRAQVVRQ